MTDHHDRGTVMGSCQDGVLDVAEHSIRRRSVEDLVVEGDAGPTRQRSDDEPRRARRSESATVSTPTYMPGFAKRSSTTLMSADYGCAPLVARSARGRRAHCSDEQSLSVESEGPVVSDPWIDLRAGVDEAQVQ